jgi:hypothetical protein
MPASGLANDCADRNHVPCGRRERMGDPPVRLPARVVPRPPIASGGTAARRLWREQVLMALDRGAHAPDTVRMVPERPDTQAMKLKGEQHGRGRQ